MKRNNYSNSKYVWLEKDLFSENKNNKNQKKNVFKTKSLENNESDTDTDPQDSNKITKDLSFDKEEFEQAVKPILIPLIHTCIQETKNSETLELKKRKSGVTNLLKNPTEEFYETSLNSLRIKNKKHFESLPLWVPLLIGILGTSTFFLFVIVCIIFRFLHTINTINTTLNQLK